MPKPVPSFQAIPLAAEPFKFAPEPYEAGKRSGAWIKLKFHQKQEFVIGGYTEPEGPRKYFGALLVGYYEGRKLKFCGRVGTGFTENHLLILSSELNKIQVKECPFFNLPAVGRSRWDRGLTAAEMKRCHWVKPVMGFNPGNIQPNRAP